MKRPILLCISEKFVTRYVSGKAWERFEITDRAEFCRSFTEAMAERIRTGVLVDVPEKAQA